MPFLQDSFQGINILNIAGRDIVLYSKDAESYVDFKTENAIQQNFKATQDIWLFVGCCKGIAL